jgi:hypothetical protein
VLKKNFFVIYIIPLKEVKLSNYILVFQGFKKKEVSLDIIGVTVFKATEAPSIVPRLAKVAVTIVPV